MGVLTPEQKAKCHVLVTKDKYVSPFLLLRDLEREDELVIKLRDQSTIALEKIRKFGFVTAAWNGQEALSKLLSPSVTEPRPNIILMGVHMPAMDGYGATRILRTGKKICKAGEGDVAIDGTSETRSGRRGG